MNEKQKKFLKEFFEKENIKQIIGLEGSLLVGMGIALIFVHYFGWFETLIPSILLIILGVGMWVYVVASSHKSKNHIGKK